MAGSTGAADFVGLSAAGGLPGRARSKEPERAPRRVPAACLPAWLAGWLATAETAHSETSLPTTLVMLPYTLEYGDYSAVYNALSFVLASMGASTVSLSRPPALCAHRARALKYVQCSLS